MARCLLLLFMVTFLARAGQAMPPLLTQTNERSFEVQGVVMALEPDGKSVKIHHEAVTNYMPAMTMDFVARNTNELAGLTAGDAVAFRLIVTTNDGWIDQIQKRDVASLNLPLGVHAGSEVEPLKEGDLLPDFAYTTESGKHRHLWQFHGQAVAFTFFFTHCPFPTYCPLLSHNFAEAEKRLRAQTAVTNWQLVTISFDPDLDTPEVLKAYANSYGNDPAHWNFAVSSLASLTAFSDQLGLQFWREKEGGISHNLRTVVVDATGHIQSIYQGNQWTVDELVQDLTKAAAVK